MRGCAGRQPAVKVGALSILRWSWKRETGGNRGTGKRGTRLQDWKTGDWKTRERIGYGNLESWSSLNSRHMQPKHVLYSLLRHLLLPPRKYMICDPAAMIDSHASHLMDCDCQSYFVQRRIIDIVDFCFFCLSFIQHCFNYVMWRVQFVIILCLIKSWLIDFQTLIQEGWQSLVQKLLKRQQPQPATEWVADICEVCLLMPRDTSGHHCFCAACL